MVITNAKQRIRTRMTKKHWFYKDERNKTHGGVRLWHWMQSQIQFIRIQQN